MRRWVCPSCRLAPTGPPPPRQGGAPDWTYDLAGAGAVWLPSVHDGPGAVAAWVPPAQSAGVQGQRPWPPEANSRRLAASEG